MVSFSNKGFQLLDEKCLQGDGVEIAVALVKSVWGAQDVPGRDL